MVVCVNGTSLGLPPSRARVCATARFNSCAPGARSRRRASPLVLELFYEDLSGKRTRHYQADAINPTMEDEIGSVRPLAIGLGSGLVAGGSGIAMGRKAGESASRSSKNKSEFMDEEGAHPA